MVDYVITHAIIMHQSSFLAFSQIIIHCPEHTVLYCEGKPFIGAWQDGF